MLGGNPFCPVSDAPSDSLQGIRLQLMRDCDAIDGMVVEQFNGVEYIRVANTHKQELERLSESIETVRKRELKHHFRCRSTVPQKG